MFSRRARRTRRVARGGKRRTKSRSHPSGRDVRYLLDRFSQADLRTWQRIADSADRYWVGLYHHLEAQRQLNHSALLRALAAAPLAKVPDEPWFRLIDYEFALQPLSLVGSLTVGGRFNIGRDLDAAKFPVFPALYAGSDYQTAYAEKFGLKKPSSALSTHELALRDPNSFAAVRIRLQVERLFDLRQTANLNPFATVIRRFKITEELRTLAKRLGKKPPWLIQDAQQLRMALLAPDWRAFPVQFGIPANSQVFAGLLVEAGFEGVVYPSTKGDGQCVAVFPQNFTDAESVVELLDPVPSPECQRSLDRESLHEFLHEAGRSGAI